MSKTTKKDGYNAKLNMAKKLLDKGTKKSVIVKKLTEKYTNMAVNYARTIVYDKLSHVA